MAEEVHGRLTPPISEVSLHYLFFVFYMWIGISF
jgi:hypothetical protein